MDNEILRKTLLHYINLEYYANELDEEYQTLLSELEARCNKLIESQKSLNTKTAYTVLYKAIKTEVEEFRKQLEEGLDEAAEETLNDELRFLDLIYNKPVELGKSVGKLLTLPTIAATSLLFAPVAGNETLKQFVEHTSRNILNSYDNSLRAGYLFGQKTSDINSQISNKLAQVSKGMKSGIRTAVPSFAKTADRIVFMKNNVEVVWVATLDGRTCISCSSLSGLHFKSISEAPGTMHWQCRCILMPADKITEPIPEFDEFIEKLDDDEQESILGKERFNLYKQNYFKPKQFINNGKTISLKELRESIEREMPEERLIYKSKNGGSISALYKNITEEEGRNIAAVTAFANEGKQVRLLMNKNEYLTRSIDSLIDNKYWEVKTITKEATNLKTAISSALKRGVEQCSRIILNFEVPVDEDFLKACIEDRVRQHKRILEVAVEFNGKNKRVYSRNEILDWYKDKNVKVILNSFRQKK